MKCKNCGYEVEPNYRFCAKCGYPVEQENKTGVEEQPQQEPCGSTEEQPIAEEVNDSGATAQEGGTVPQEDGTATQDDAVPSAEPISQDAAAAAVQDAPRPPANPAPQESTAAANQANEPKHPSSQDMVSKHLSGGKIPKPAILAGAAVAVVLVVVVCFGGLSGLLNGKPDRGRIEADVRAELSDWADDGEYGYGDSFKISSFEIVNEERESLEGTLFGGVGSEYYGADVKVKASSTGVDAERTVSVSYIKQGNSWEPFSASTSDSQYTAKKGPNEEVIQRKADGIVTHADDWYEVWKLYENGKFTVSEVKLGDDGQSSAVTIACDAGSPYFDARCDVTATFEFNNGDWRLDDVVLDDDADKSSFDKLIGTWKGTFKETAGKSGKGICYGAENSEFTLDIESVDPTTGKVKGTFSGPAHYHAPTEGDQESTEGDKEIGPIEFTATLKRDSTLGHNYNHMKSMQYVAEYEMPDTGDGVITVSFGFSERDDPNAAYGALYTKVEYEESWFTTDADYEDIYTLTKA